MINSSLFTQLTYRRTGHIAHVVFDFCYHLLRHPPKTTEGHQMPHLELLLGMGREVG